MKYILFIFSIFLLFSGCQNKDVQIPNLKTYNSFDKFNYTKEDIAFFEKEFDNILKIENIEILKQYKKFYSKNSNYFLNGKVKVRKLNEKIFDKTNKINAKSDLYLLEKAKKSEKKEAIKIYKKLAKKNNIKAQRKLVEFYKISNPEISLQWLEKLVKENDIHSMKSYASANIYMVRPVIIQDLKKALDTYEKLAKKGELSSMMRLGNIYEYGYHKEVAPQDKEKALEYYEQASSKGYFLAKRKLFEIYSCKKCKANRYNLKKAKKLQKELLNYIKKQKTIIVHNKETKENQLISIAPTNKKVNLPILKTIACYDIEDTKTNIGDDCKNEIISFIQNNPKISKIIVTSIISEKEEKHFDKSINNETFREAILKNLANDRLFKTVWFLKTNLKDDSLVSITTYFVKSKTKAGVLLKIY